MVDPKSCPFCGSTMVFVETLWTDDLKRCSVQCDSCEARGPETLNEEAAIRRWNERTEGKS